MKKLVFVFCFFSFFSEARDFIPCQISSSDTRLGGVANGYISEEYIKEYLTQDDPNECEAGKKNTALYLTIYNYRLDLFELFLNNPYGIKGNLFVTATGISILSYAAKWGDSIHPVSLTFIDRIMKEAPSLVNKQNPNGSFPIHYAALSGDKVVFDKIASRLKEDEVKVLGEYNKDVLHYVAQMPFYPWEDKLDGQSELLRHLVHDRGFKVDSRDSRGYTPLLLAIAQNNIEAVKTLLNLGASLDVVNKDGYGPLDFVVYIPIDTNTHKRPIGMLSNEDQKKYMARAEEMRLAFARFLIETQGLSSPETIKRSLSFAEMELEDLESIVKRDRRSFYKYAIPGYKELVSYLRYKALVSYLRSKLP